MHGPHQHAVCTYACTTSSALHPKYPNCKRVSSFITDATDLRTRNKRHYRTENCTKQVHSHVNALKIQVRKSPPVTRDPVSSSPQKLNALKCQ